MTVRMVDTITESINGGRTSQVFLRDGVYPVPDHLGQIWIGRGWAVAAGEQESGQLKKGKG